MIRVSAHGGLLRARDGGEQPVTPLELFFDLVFVFAVTQLSHRLLDHLTIGSALETLLLLVAVWRAWVDTTWVTNWFDPDRTPVRLLLVTLMLISLLMSVAIPEAFAEGGLMFALAYVTIKAGRTAFVVLVLERSSSLGRNFQRILAWFAIPAMLWVAGGLLHGETRNVLWVIAPWCWSTQVRWPASGRRVSGAPPPPTGRSRVGTSPSVAGCSSSLLWASLSW
jgi:low temperature requirement protein LtrA